MLANTKPKKKDQMTIGCFSNKVSISFAKDKILILIPKRSANKKGPLTIFQTLLNPYFFNTDNRLKLKLLIEFNNSSYMPEIKAIVPPETPGTTSAAPIAIPFKDKII